MKARRWRLRCHARGSADAVQRRWAGEANPEGCASRPGIKAEGGQPGDQTPTTTGADHSKSARQTRPRQTATKQNDDDRKIGNQLTSN